MGASVVLFYENRDKAGLKLNTAQTFALYAMAGYAGDNGTSLLSYRRLANILGYTGDSAAEQVRRIIVSLEEAGEVERLARHRPNGSVTSNEVRLLAYINSLPKEDGATTVATEAPKPKGDGAAVKALVVAYAEAMSLKWANFKIVNWPREMKTAKKLLEMGYTPEELKRVVRSMLEDKWNQTHGLGLETVVAKGYLHRAKKEAATVPAAVAAGAWTNPFEVA